VRSKRIQRMVTQATVPLRRGIDSLAKAEARMISADSDEGGQLFRFMSDTCYD